MRIGKTSPDQGEAFLGKTLAVRAKAIMNYKKCVYGLPVCRLVDGIPGNFS